MAIRDASKAWSAAAQAKDPDKFTSFYADDGVLLLHEAPEISGRMAIHDTIAMVMKDPAFALSFEPSSVEVARSGDLAYELATYTITETDAKTTKPGTDKGVVVRVWKKQAGGGWKVRVDVPVVGPPETPVAAAPKK
jgi:uncharacterized protein (TIGR02246 family)